MGSVTRPAHPDGDLVGSLGGYLDRLESDPLVEATFAQKLYRGLASRSIHGSP